MASSTAFISSLPLVSSSSSSSSSSSARSQTWHRQYQCGLLHRHAQRYFRRRRLMYSDNPVPGASGNAMQPLVTMSADGPRTDSDNTQPSAQDLAKLYGGSYLGTSIGMSVVSFGVLYALVYVGVDVRSLTNAFGDWLGTTPLGRPAALDNVSDAASAAAIAYVAHKVTSPLRFPLTIAATPFVARIFSKKSDENPDQAS